MKTTEFVGLQVFISEHTNPLTTQGIHLCIKNRTRQEILSGVAKLPHAVSTSNTIKEKLKGYIKGAMMRALDSSSSELMLFDVICISARNRLGHVVPVLPTNSHQTCIVRSFIPTHVPEREPLAACSRQGLRMTLPVKSSRCLTSSKNSNENVERYNNAYRCDDATARQAVQRPPAGAMNYIVKKIPRCARSSL